MTWYSQAGEDAIYVPMLPEHGRCLEIGAWSPTEFSNSRALIERGWSALLIEPSPGPVRDLVREYGGPLPCIGGRVAVLAAAVALEPGILDLQVSDDAISSADAAHNAQWVNHGQYGRLLVPAITLEDIANRWGGFDFISIDVEGGSVDLAKRAFELGWGPRIMVVEYDQRLPELLAAATSAGYHAVSVNGTNVIMRRGGE